LKQRIDGLQLKVNDLRDMLLALCAAHASGDSIAVLDLLHRSFGQGDFSQTSDLAQILRSSTNLHQLNRQPLGQLSQGPCDRSANNFRPLPRILQHGYIGGCSSIEQDIGALSPATNEPLEWFTRAGHKVDTAPGLQGYPSTYLHQGAGY